MQVSKVNNQVNGIAKIKLMIWVWDLAHACVAFMAGQYEIETRSVLLTQCHPMMINHFSSKKHWCHAPAVVRLAGIIILNILLTMKCEKHMP